LHPAFILLAARLWRRNCKCHPQIFSKKGEEMKKLFAITLMLLSIGFVGWGENQAATSTISSANGVTNAANAVPQEWRYRQNRRWRNPSRVRTVRTTRIVRYGYRTYRETYLVRYLPNGRTQTTLLSRERIA
jgi:hypothetical protein